MVVSVTESTASIGPSNISSIAMGRQDVALAFAIKRFLTELEFVHVFIEAVECFEDHVMQCLQRLIPRESE